MPVGSTTYAALRDALEATLATVSGLTVLDHAQQDVVVAGQLPALVLGLPRVERSRALERESAIGKVDVLVTWPAQLIVRLGDPTTGYDEALDYVGAVQGALDADPSLTTQSGSAFSQIHTAKLVAAEPTLPDDQGQQIVGYDLTIEVALVASRT